MNFKTWSDGPEGIVSEADPDKFGENLRLSGEAQSGRAVEIVGEFADERDTDLNIQQIDSKTLECEGRTEIETMNELFLGLKIPSGNYETIAGYILSQTGTIPEKGTQIETNQLIITVETVNSRSIQKVMIRRKSGNLLHSNI